MKDTPFIIPLFIPHVGCPFQCAFCNQKALTSVIRPDISLSQLKREIDLFLTYKKKPAYTEIAFFGGTFLGLEKEVILELLELAQSYINNGIVDSIRFSTRPDTITVENINLIKNYSVKTIEVGVQSMDALVLKESRRGHTEEDVIKAVNILKKNQYITGMQLMVGLPYDNEKKSITTALKTVELKPDIVRIYPALVLKNSPMEEWYLNRTYTPLSLEDSVNIVKKTYTLFLANNIKVIRVGIQASKDLEEGTEIVAGPYHPSFGHMVSSSIFLDMAINILSKCKLHNEIDIHVNPSSISEMRGLKNCNIITLKKKYSLSTVKVIADNSIDKDSLSINNNKIFKKNLLNNYVKNEIQA
ncbi:MAG: radical SAM protein [Desulfobacterales bacterium]|nr:radical SAM protein [Desulfobacterales bacterium]MCP4158805.1 radical SAM protein [Deltaproteobacteria bacterium]